MNDLIQILKEKHGYSEEESKRIICTFSDLIKKKFPEVVDKLSALLQIDDKINSIAKEQSVSTAADLYIPDNALKDNQQLSKDKQSGFYEGNKRDY